MLCHWSAQNQNLNLPDLGPVSEYSHVGWWPILQIIHFVSVVGLEGRHKQWGLGLLHTAVVGRAGERLNSSPWLGRGD